MLKLVAQLIQSDYERYDKLNTRFHESNLSLHFGASMLESDKQVRKKFLHDEYIKVVREYGHCKGIETVVTKLTFLDAPIQKYSYRGFMYTGFHRIFIEDIDEISQMAFTIQLPKLGKQPECSKTIIYGDLKKDVLRLRPESTADDYIFLDAFEFYEMILYYLLVSDIRSRLNSTKIALKETSSLGEFFDSSEEWKNLKRELQVIGYVEDGKWKHRHRNRSDLAWLVQLLDEYTIINVTNVGPAAKIAYKEFGFEMDEDPYLQSRSLTNPPGGR